MTAVADAPQRMEFKTELKQLLDLIIHSLYTKKEIFLRELISNAADAIDKLRFESLTNPDLLEGQTRLEDQAHPRREGRHADRLRQRHRHVARGRSSRTSAPSPSRAPRRSSRTSRQADVKERPELIGQFGVGFYASFMVADRVTVLSRAAGAGRRGREVGIGRAGRVHRRAVDKPTRGTDVILHLRDDAKEFLSDLAAAGDRQALLRLHRPPDRHRRREGEGRQEDDRRGDAQQPPGDLAAAQERGEAGGVQRRSTSRSAATTTTR